MTVSAQVKQTAATLKSAQANLASFALSTGNQQARELYDNAAQVTQEIVESLQLRVRELEEEEPQYRAP
ncbi:MAG TPA: DUF1657 domain-containing protein [Bacilli bacterium]|nr:DUF1657 domain-containing protein [Bacilli bacterium]